MRLCNYVNAFIAVLAATSCSNAGTITFTELDFTNPVLEFSFGSSVTIPSGTSAGQYTIGAIFACDFCSPSSSSPSTLDLGGVQIVCTNPGLSGVCGPLDLQFDVQGGSDSSGAPILDVLPFLSGSGDSVTGFAQICIADSEHICSSNGSGSQSINIPFSGAISGGGEPATFGLSNSFSVFGDFHIDGLQADQTGITLADSFAVTLVPESLVTFPPPPEVPEPATSLLLLTGIGGLFALRKSGKLQRWLELRTRELKNNLNA